MKYQKQKSTRQAYEKNAGRDVFQFFITEIVLANLEKMYNLVTFFMIVDEYLTFEKVLCFTLKIMFD